MMYELIYEGYVKLKNEKFAIAYCFKLTVLYLAFRLKVDNILTALIHGIKIGNRVKGIYKLLF